MLNSSVSIAANPIRITGYFLPSNKNANEQKIFSSSVEVETFALPNCPPKLRLVQAGLPTQEARTSLAVGILAGDALVTLLGAAQFFVFPTRPSLFADALLKTEDFLHLSSQLEVADDGVLPDWLLALSPLLELFAPRLWQISAVSQAQWTQKTQIESAPASAVIKAPETFIWSLFKGHPQEIPIFLALDEHRWVQLAGDLQAPTGLLLRADVVLSAPDFKNLHLDRAQREEYVAAAGRALSSEALQDALWAAVALQGLSLVKTHPAFTEKLMGHIAPAQLEAEDLLQAFVKETKIEPHAPLYRRRVENVVQWSVEFEWEKSLFRLTFASKTGFELDEVFLHRQHVLVRARVRPSLRALLRMLEEFKNVRPGFDRDAAEKAAKTLAAKQPFKGGF